jgi:uncharacterized protein DUF4129
MLLGMRRRLPALVAVVALLMVAAVVARGTSAVPVGEGRPLLGFLRIPEIDLSPPGDSGSEADTWSGPGGWTAVISWVIVLIPLFLLATAIVAAVVFAVIGWRRHRVGLATPALVEEDGEQGDVPRARLLHAARAAHEIMERQRGGEPSDAVIAAWLRLEQAAADSGTERLAHQTPTEFTDTLLDRYDTVGPALDELRRLYQRARFAPSADVGAAEEAAARAALEEIVRGLTRKPVAR